MYSTCIYCRLPLGANETIEHFPIGRKLAFDAHKGRLWVICTSCSRWNLTPLEERWEAIEEAERIFRETRKRYSSENIGLARARDGLDLVRVGKPLRPEFAAWRYGAQFTKRRRTHLIVATAVTAGGLAAYTGALAIGGPILLSGLIAPTVNSIIKRVRTGRPEDIVANVEGTDGSKLAIRREDLARIDLVPEKADRWGVSLPTMVFGTVHLVDSAAIRVAGLALAHRNIAGASKTEVDTAVAKLELFKGSDGLLRFLAKQGPLSQLNVEQRLALEMAAHEDAERRALEGELHELELAWREAEELAAIADNMFLPASVMEWIRKHRP
jgi:hypothetical protein